VGESLVLLGISARRMLQALADGETDPTAPLATLAAPRLRATPEQLRCLRWLTDDAAKVGTVTFAPKRVRDLTLSVTCRGLRRAQ
jgi:hypothetical protein